MTDIGATVGKIPPIGWAVAIGGGLFIAFYLRSNKSGDTPPVDITGGVGTGAGTSTFIPASPPVSTDAPMDIETWGVKALAYLIGAGYSPLEAAQAIRKFIDGQQISSKEKAMIDAALKGVPGLTGIPVGGGVAPDDSTANKEYRVTVEGQHVDQFAHYYGMSVAGLYLLNPGIGAYVTWANDRGYLSPTNPANGTEVQVFGSAQTVRIR